MKTQLIVACIALLPGAIFTTYSTALPKAKRNEEWLLTQIPNEVPGYKLLRDKEGSKITYKMDPVTYEELSPIGIAAQVYEAPGGARYEVIVIAGDRMSTFHDQRTCFVMQNWNLVKNSSTQLPKTDFGDIPVMELEVAKEGVGSRPAMFVWRSPSQFTIDRKVAKTDFFFGGLSGRPNLVGFSYRFMGASPEATQDGLTTFAGHYFNSLKKIESASTN